MLTWIQNGKQKPQKDTRGPITDMSAQNIPTTLSEDPILVFVVLFYLNLILNFVIRTLRNYLSSILKRLKLLKQITLTKELEFDVQVSIHLLIATSPLHLSVKNANTTEYFMFLAHKLTFLLVFSPKIKVVISRTIRIVNAVIQVLYGVVQSMKLKPTSNDTLDQRRTFSFQLSLTLKRKVFTLLVKSICHQTVEDQELQKLSLFLSRMLNLLLSLPGILKAPAGLLFLHSLDQERKQCVCVYWMILWSWCYQTHVIRRKENLYMCNVSSSNLYEERGFEEKFEIRDTFLSTHTRTMIKTRRIHLCLVVCVYCGPRCML